MDENVVVSVVILSYNHENFIERCTRSVTCQTFKNFEIIFIDNNSQDKSYEKAWTLLNNSGVKFYAEKTKKNLGIAKGINYGIERAKGEFISVLAGDDWWDLENLFEKVQYAFANPEYGLIYGNGYAYNHMTQAINLFYEKPAVSGWIFKDILGGLSINTQGVLYKHELLKLIGCFDENAKVEDLDLWLRLAKVTPIGYVHKALTFYRHNNGNNISNNFTYMLEGCEYIFNKYRYEFPKEVKKLQLKQYTSFAYTLAEHHPSIKSLKFIFKNYKFNYLYNKQILKCLIKMAKKI